MCTARFKTVFPPAVHIGLHTGNSEKVNNVVTCLHPNGVWGNARVTAGGKSFLKHVTLTLAVTSKCFTA